MTHLINQNRVRKLNDLSIREGKVVYWMSRDQRVENNWALLYAQNIALETQSNLEVVFCLDPNFLNAPLRHFDFMLKGLEEIEVELTKICIPFKILIGDPIIQITKYCEQNNVGACISDFSPLKISRNWKEKVGSEIKCALFEVDAHNIVPCWIASDKQEFAARTFRPKIHKLLDEYLTEFPKLVKQNSTIKNNNDWVKIHSAIKTDKSVTSIDWLKSGEKAANKILKLFLDVKIQDYEDLKNDPTKNNLSNLSPYLHFGQISSQEIALKTKRYESFFEELVVRKELSDNYCFYNKEYDSFNGFPDWAKNTLNEHKKDKREFVYSVESFENAKTHDIAWNAAQIQMIRKGKMHGYMRMYWAKKIFEWSETPEEAMNTAIYLNDKYELDGRDPNGYTGIAWSIGGVHDRPWFEKPVFGKVRYMNFNGLKRKFNVEKYINEYISV